MNIKDEKGAALVLTLMMITLLLLFITTLSGQIVQTTTQVTTMEKRMDAELVSQMGIDYVQAILDDYNYSKNPDLLNYMEEKIPVNVPIGDKGNRQFEIELPESIDIEENNDVTFKSTGKAQGQSVVTEGTINITIE